MPSIQSGEAQILTYTDGEMLSFRFENCITLILQSLVYDTWVSYSEGGLQSASQRFKVAVQSDGSTKLSRKKANLANLKRAVNYQEKPILLIENLFKNTILNICLGKFRLIMIFIENHQTLKCGTSETLQIGIGQLKF